MSKVEIATVVRVLSDHKVDMEDWQDGVPPLWLDELAELLREANGDLSPSVELATVQRNEHARRVERIDLLQRLIASYGKDFARDARNAGKSMRNNGGDFDTLTHDLKELMRVENQLLRTQPQGEFPSNRPPKAKNECARQMVEILRQRNVRPRRACDLVAAMFAEVGIGNPDPQQEAKNLWDRVR